MRSIFRFRLESKWHTTYPHMTSVFFTEIFIFLRQKLRKLCIKGIILIKKFAAALILFLGSTLDIQVPQTIIEGVLIKLWVDTTKCHARWGDVEEKTIASLTYDQLRKEKSFLSELMTNHNFATFLYAQLYYLTNEIGKIPEQTSEGHNEYSTAYQWPQLRLFVTLILC